jgi:hypothetical protein
LMVIFWFLDFISGMWPTRVCVVLKNTIVRPYVWNEMFDSCE